MFMPGNFTSHNPKPARVTRIGAAPGPAAQAAAPASTPRPAPTGEPTGKSPTGDTGKPKEIGGPSGPEPTRYGDWERKGICVDF